jgi:hypothetical protein
VVTQGEQSARRARALAKKRRKVLSETYRNLAIARFGRFASIMSTISAHSCGVGCQLLFGIALVPRVQVATHYDLARSRRKSQRHPFTGRK